MVLAQNYKLMVSDDSKKQIYSLKYNSDILNHERQRGKQSYQRADSCPLTSWSLAECWLSGEKHIQTAASLFTRNPQGCIVDLSFHAQLNFYSHGRVL